jgi:hypothetical protein
MDKPLKKLPRDAAGNLSYEPFEASGRKYRFIKPGDPIGIKKWQEYEKLKIVAGVGRSFVEIANTLKEVNALLGADKPFADIRTEGILLVDSLRRSIIDMSNERHSKFLYLCTIFIYRDGTNPAEWDFETATEVIEDWAAEGMDEQDLLFFSLCLIPGWQAVFSELREKADAEAERLSAISTLTAKK